MNLEELKNQLKEKKALRDRAEIAYQQLTGQIALLEEMIIQEENKNIEAK